MQNILLIGGAGFIGSSIAEQLIFKNHNVFILELPGTDLSRLYQIKDRVKIYYGKLENYDLIRDILNENIIDTVIHLVSTLIPSSSLQSYLAEVEIVIKPTINLLSILSDLNVKLIYFSSGGTIYGTKKDAFFSERSPLAPISYYGQSKLLIEESIKFENRRSGLNYLILRPSNPYGIGQAIYGKQGLIAASVGNIINNKKITIWGNGSVIRDYIYIDDLVDAIISIIKLGGDNEIYNIGSGKGYSVNEVIDTLTKCIAEKIEVEYVAARSVDVPSVVLDITKLHTIFKPNYLSLEEGIRIFFLHEKQKSINK
jgi:UDP-glucose 4-epimerase